MRPFGPVARILLAGSGFMSGTLYARPTSLQLPAEPPSVTQTPLPEAPPAAHNPQLVQKENALRSNLSSHPGDAATLYELGRVLQFEDRPKESLAVFTEAARSRVPSPDDLRFVARDYVLLLDYEDAAQWMQRALDGDPANAEAWYDMGRVRMMQSKFSIAETALLHSLKLTPKPNLKAGASTLASKTENNLGVVYEAQGRSADAIAAYKRAIELQADSHSPSEQPLLNYGKLLVTESRGAEAIPLLQAAVDIAPADPKCREQLARAFEASAAGDQGKLDRAQQEMLAAVRLDPSNARLHFQLGMMYRRAGKAELAHEQMEASRKLYGSHSTSPDR